MEQLPTIHQSPPPTDRKAKQVVRTKSGCYTCRLRGKKCDEKRDEHSTCLTCARLHIECLGFGYKYPNWLVSQVNQILAFDSELTFCFQDKNTRTSLRNIIKSHLQAQGLIKGVTGCTHYHPSFQAPVLRLRTEQTSTPMVPYLPLPPYPIPEPLSVPNTQGSVLKLTVRFSMYLRWPESHSSDDPAS